MSFRRSAKLTVEHGVVATYVHNAVADGLGKLGVLVAIETDGRCTRPPTPSPARSPCMSPPPTRWR